MNRRGPIGAVAARVPLRIQLVASILILGALAMVAFGSVGTERLRSNLDGSLDARLTSFASEVSNPGGDPGSSFGGMNGHGALTGNSTWYAVVDDSGHLLDADGQRTGAAVPGFVVRRATQTAPRLPTVTSAYAAAHAGPFTVVATGSGARWRVFLVHGPFIFRASGTTVQGTLITAFSQESVDGPVSALTRIDVILGLGVLILLGLAAWLVVRASLRPLVDVERTAEAIAGGDLSRRVPVASDRTEVGRLGASLNTMLGHIEVAFGARSASEAAARATAEQMRRFAADASHELRTPLTSIRGFAELSRAGVIPPGPETDRAMGRIESEAIRMTGLVEDLLLLARLDQQRPLERRPVDLLAIAADAVHDAAAIAGDHPTTLVVPDDATSGPEPVVLGDEARLRQVVSNLLANALHHTPPGTAVRVGVRTAGPNAVLEVSDDGPGLAPADAGQVFERFYRADSSRARSSGGSGLGLSIVAALVAAHSGTVDVRTAPGQGASFIVSLPLAPDPAGRPDPATAALSGQAARGDDRIPRSGHGGGAGAVRLAEGPVRLAEGTVPTGIGTGPDAEHRADEAAGAEPDAGAAPGVPAASGVPAGGPRR